VAQKVHIGQHLRARRERHIADHNARRFTAQKKHLKIVAFAVALELARA
jgi:hypothetical protein